MKFSLYKYCIKKYYINSLKQRLAVRPAFLFFLLL